MEKIANKKIPQRNINLLNPEGDDYFSKQINF